MEYIDITKWNDTVIKSISNPFYKSKYKVGIINNLTLMLEQTKRQ